MGTKPAFELLSVWLHDPQSPTAVVVEQNLRARKGETEAAAALILIREYRSTAADKEKHG